MGANATTFVPAYVAGEVLTAADLTVTNSGIPVFATTVTRDAAFGGTGEKTLAQGQTCYIEATSSYQTYNGSAWVAFGAGALTLIKAQTIGSAVSSVAVTDVFSSTYTNYRIIMSNSDFSTADQAVAFTLGSSTSSYYSASRLIDFNGNATSVSRNNQASAYTFISTGNNDTGGSFDIYQPFATEFTTWAGTTFTYNYTVLFGGVHSSATSHTGFTFTSLAGTMTGGTIRVYGYANS